jgi:PKD repeat protein
MYASAGTYTARITVANTQGATDSATQTIQVSAAALPRTFSGTGDFVTPVFALQEGLATFEIRHTGQSNFIVELDDAGGHWVALLVNEIGNYSGTTLVGVTAGGFGASPGGHLLKVTADATWTITVRQSVYVFGPLPPRDYGGVGDSVTLPFELSEGLATFDIHHTGQSNFSVELYDAGGNWLDLLANEIDDYSGTALVGVQAGSPVGASPGVHVLAVTADGSWTIAVRQPHYPSGASLPWSCTGTGDTVTGPVELPVGTIQFTMSHSGSSNFAVELYSAGGGWADLLANEIGVYSGSKVIEVQADPLWTAPGTYVVSVRADGAWSLGVGKQ